MKLLFLSLIFTVSSCSYESPTLSRKTIAADAKEEPTPIIAETTNQEPVNDQEPASQVVPAVRSSGGTGGPTGMNEISFTDSNGMSSTYKINVPEDASVKVYGLHIHFHGDGGGGYRDFPNVETRHELMGVTVRAPSGNLRWGRGEGVAHSNYAQELIQNEIIKKYNINLDRIYFSGVSGGAYFLSGSFLPEYGNEYQSGAFLMCGGEAPRIDFQNPQAFQNFRIHWQVTAGERTDIADSIQRSVAAYKSVLEQVNGDPQRQSIETIGSGGHCEFFEMPYTPGIQAMVDAKFKMILPLEEQAL